LTPNFSTSITCGHVHRQTRARVIDNLATLDHVTFTCTFQNNSVGVRTALSAFDAVDVLEVADVGVVSDTSAYPSASNLTFVRAFASVFGDALVSDDVARAGTASTPRTSRRLHALAICSIAVSAAACACRAAAMLAASATVLAAVAVVGARDVVACDTDPNSACVWSVKSSTTNEITRTHPNRQRLSCELQPLCRSDRPRSHRRIGRVGRERQCGREQCVEQSHQLLAHRLNLRIVMCKLITVNTVTTMCITLTHQRQLQLAQQGAHASPHDVLERARNELCQHQRARMLCAWSADCVSRHSAATDSTRAYLSVRIHDLTEPK
jgi:hypothetical protein